MTTADERADLDEFDRLTAWKAEALAVLDEWEKVYEALGSPGPLGASKAKSALAAVERLKAAQACERCENVDATLAAAEAALDLTQAFDLTGPPLG